LTRTAARAADEAKGAGRAPEGERNALAPEADKLLTASEAADRLGLGPQTLKKSLRSGEWPSVRRGRNWLVPLSFVLMLLYSWRPGSPGSDEDVAERWLSLAKARYAAAEALLAEAA
jgi:excisionase family DNA binding protein